MFDLLKKLMEDEGITNSFGADGSKIKKDTVLDPLVYDVDSIINKLENGEEEVETITFGLENDEGDIIKVYVNHEQADDFEKALADKLGEEDNIEILLADLSKDFDIVDVEWPDDENEEMEAGDALNIKKNKDELVDDDISDNTGEESMNKNVKEASYGDQVKSRLFQKFNMNTTKR